MRGPWYSSASSDGEDSEMELLKTPKEERTKLISAEGPAKGAHWAVSGVLLFNGLVGGGLLGLPYAVINAGGFPTAIPMIIIYGILACLNHLILARCADLTKTDTFEDMVRSLLGELAYRIVVVVLFFVSFLINIFLLVGIADMLREASYGYFGPEAVCSDWIFQRWSLLLIVIVVVIGPSCLVKHIDGLKYVSGAATAGVGVVVASVIYHYFHSDTRATDIPTSPGSLWQFLLSAPGVAVAFGNHFASVSIYARQAEKGVSSYAKSVGLSGLTGTALYCLVAIFVCLMFGARVQDDFIKSYQEEGRGMTLALFVYSFKLTFEYPLIQFVGWLTIESMLDWTPFDVKQYWWFWKRLLVSSIWILLTAVTGLLFPAVSYFTPLLGALTIAISFVYPGMCLIAATVFYSRDFARPRLFRYAGVGILCLGAALITSSLISIPTAVHYLHLQQAAATPLCPSTT